MDYAELQTTTNFSFLRGASHAEELIEQAAAYSYSAIAITDRNTFAGIVRAHVAAKKTGIRMIPACRLDLLDGPSLLAYPCNREAYARLSALLTVGNLRAEKGECHLYKKDVFQHAGGMKFIAVPPPALTPSFELDQPFQQDLKEYHDALGTDLYLAAARSYNGDDTKKLYRLSQLAVKLNIPLAAVNDVHYHHPERRQLQDVLTCIREKCTIQTAGFHLQQNAERYLKPVSEMLRLFRQYPSAIRHSQEIAEACKFSLDELEYIYPEEILGDFKTPMKKLNFLTWQGAALYWGQDIPEKMDQDIKKELAFIERHNLAPYFITVEDLCREAWSRGILYQGRGSACNSVICYCLRISFVDPTKFDLLFERFMSDARDERPDIDVDFEHERREEIIQYIYEKYGRDRAAIVATVTHERQKGAIRDVGKVMGLSVDTINSLSASQWEFTEEWFDGKLLAEQGLNPNDPHLRKVLQLTGQLMGFPRQLGQHTGGFVITNGKLSDLCPILNARMADRTCIEWDKDDIEALGFFKVDVLALGMLTCIRKAFDLAKIHYGLQLILSNVPQDDPEVYDMISRAETIGVFQIESRAQQSMLPRLKPRCFYDLVIEVAIVRPGPIVGNMVHPYLRRRNGDEPVEYESKELEEILKRTLGVPLFQEQAMKIAIVAAGFTAAEADGLRRSMATFKAKGLVSQFEHKLIQGMLAKGYNRELAERIFRQLEGFGSYGFPESHAASFALLVYISSWLKCYYPDVFAAAILNSQPMGFYPASDLVADARKNGVVVRPVDINFSCWDNTLEEKAEKYCAMRLGFRQVRGLREEDMQALVAGREKPYINIHSLLDAGVPFAALEKLADADAFRSMGLDRREALWEVTAMSDRPIALFTGQASESVSEQISLPLMTESEHVVQDYASTALSLKAHPIGFLREKLSLLHIKSSAEVNDSTDGILIKVAGLVKVKQRPGTAKGICFITLEDETGYTNLIVYPKLFDEYRKQILQARLLMVEGRLQREGTLIHIIVTRCFDLSILLRQLTGNQYDPTIHTLSRANENSIPTHVEKAAQAKGEKKVFSKGRNFK